MVLSYREAVKRRWVRKAQREPETATINSASVVSTACCSRTMAPSVGSIAPELVDGLIDRLGQAQHGNEFPKCRIGPEPPTHRP